MIKKTVLNKSMSWLFKHLNKVKDLFLDHLLVMLVINVINTGINCKDFHSLMSIDPVFMSFMNCLKIIKPYILLSFSISNFNPRVTNLWWAFEVNDTLNRTVLDKSVTDWIIDFVLMRFKVSIFVHDLSKNKSIS